MYEKPEIHYPLKPGDNFNESLLMYDEDEDGDRVEFGLPSRVVCHFRDAEFGGESVITCDSDATQDPDGTCSVVRSGTTDIQVGLDIPAAITKANLDERKTYYGDLVLIGSSGRPDPYTECVIVLHTDPDHTVHS